jgi:hypothetical protein
LYSKAQSGSNHFATLSSRKFLNVRHGRSANENPRRDRQNLVGFLPAYAKASALQADYISYTAALPKIVMA